MNTRAIVLSLGLLVVQNALSQTLPGGEAQTITLKPFTTDGCSAFPDGTPLQQTMWLQCCTAHDLAYWQEVLKYRESRQT